MLDKAKGESENTTKKETENETIGREFYFCFHLKPIMLFIY